MAKEYVIEGNHITSMDSFFAEVERALRLPYPCSNLDALDDALSETFGGIENGSTIRWRHAKGSEHRLGALDFKRIVQAIRGHRADGSQSEDNIQLVLE